MDERFCVYILASRSGVLYIGVTSNLERRLEEHRGGLRRGSFSRRYQTHRLVHCESAKDIHAALRREKQLKGWSRAKKVALISGANPSWAEVGIEAVATDGQERRAAARDPSTPALRASAQDDDAVR